MNLDAVTAELRPRSAWEAADFGVRLVRRDAAAIYRAWFATSLPLLLLALGIVYLSPWPGLALLLYWWLEPIVDAPVLDIIARRLFGGEPEVGRTLKSTPRLAWRNRLFLLTPWRLHFARSIAMPVTQLERLTGSERRKRAAVLNSVLLNHGIGLTVVYHHLVGVVYLGVLLGALALIPVEYRSWSAFDVGFSLFEADGRHASAANLLLFYLAQSLLEPWFVGAGFGLYINCRTRLEAWDIEVAFRRMVSRRAAATVLVAICIALPAVTLADAASDDPGFAGYWAESEYREAIDTVFADEALTDSETRMVWRPKYDLDAGDEAEAGESVAWRAAGLLVSSIVEFGLWVLVGLLLLWLYLKRDLWLPYLERGPRRRSRPRQRVFIAGGEIKADTLPDDVPAAVRSLWADGRWREALSLLYRASVFASVVHHGVRLPDSATERACLEAVTAQADADRSRYFRSLVQTWVRAAYGARPPSAGEFETLLDGYVTAFEAEPA